MKFYTVDLFAGCGGLSEGFEQSGFETIAQVEMDKWACETLRSRQIYYGLKQIGKNTLYNRYFREEIQSQHIFNKYSDLKASVTHKVIRAELNEEENENIFERIEASRRLHSANKIHVILGGPPCQPYSLMGRARDPGRMAQDNRHYLYREYLAILSLIQPDFFVYENVPGLFTAKAQGKDVFLKLLEDFLSLDPPYEITPPLQTIYADPGSYILNSADFKIPQRRKRLILIGYRKSLEKSNPDLRSIFARLQKKALNNGKKGRLTVDDAIGDLPPLTPGEGKDGWYGEYDRTPDLKHYQIMMRKGSAGISNHKARTHMDSDLERYRFFISHHMNAKKAATLEDLKRKKPEILPNHRHLDKFLDRFKVQWWNHPSSTVTAHISKDGHYFIHPDITQCRSFTVREAARCQSFPDNFKFEGPRTHQFRQVGNAVPPLLANAIARLLKKKLEEIYEK